jgi:hypothetical protein
MNWFLAINVLVAAGCLGGFAIAINWQWLWGMISLFALYILATAGLWYQYLGGTPSAGLFAYSAMVPLAFILIGAGLASMAKNRQSIREAL